MCLGLIVVASGGCPSSRTIDSLDASHDTVAEMRTESGADADGTCAPQDVRAARPCGPLEGKPAPRFRWDGDRCVLFQECVCEGRDCDRLYMTERDCRIDHARCGSLGSCRFDSDCDHEEYCDPCARSSCPECPDCVRGCLILPCSTNASESRICLCDRTDCGDDAVSVLRDGCWVCLAPSSCALSRCRRMR